MGKNYSEGMNKVNQIKRRISNGKKRIISYERNECNKMGKKVKLTYDLCNRYQKYFLQSVFDLHK